MSEFMQFNLNDVVDQIGEDRAKTILSSFSCPMNEDVQSFIKEKAIEFSKRGFSKTYLVYWQEVDEKELIGYYTIANKHFTLSKGDVGRKMFERVKQHGTYNSGTNQYIITAPLIAQLGKNFYTGNDTLIYGSELLKMAEDRIRKVQREMGGKFLYLECEDTPKLISFYETNGYASFGKRMLDRDEVPVIKGEYLIQMLKYLK